MAVAAILVLFFGVFTTTPVHAGEIVLYTRTQCTGYEYIFAAGATTDCRTAEQTITGALYYGASTSRDIGNSCKFSLYTDSKCNSLAGTINSSGPFKKCLPIAKGIGSYKITCNNPVAANLARPNTKYLTVNTYLQPQVTFHGSPSGNHDITAGLDYCGTDIKSVPTGKPASVGTKLASAFFSTVPAGAQNFTTSITDGGTLYRITLQGSKNNNYNAFTAARQIGQAAFASLMADTAAQMHSRPCDYFTYSIYDDPATLGYLNMSYVAP